MDPFVAEIRIFSGNFAPSGWATCDGQLLPISQNTALFSLLGTTYGGDGRTTFGLPNLQGSAPMHQGQGTGLSRRYLGETGGVETVTLNESQMPAHSHPSLVDGTNATAGTPSSVVTLAATIPKIYGPAADLQGFGTPTGVGQMHNNMQPYLALTFIIALQGVFPPRS